MDLVVVSFLFLHSTHISFSFSRMGRPTRIVFLDSDGNTAFEYRVPKGQSDMVRVYTNRKSSPPASFSVPFATCAFESLCFLRGGEKLSTRMMNALTP